MKGSFRCAFHDTSADCGRDCDKTLALDHHNACLHRRFLGRVALCWFGWNRQEIAASLDSSTALCIFPRIDNCLYTLFYNSHKYHFQDDRDTICTLTWITSLYASYKGSIFHQPWMVEYSTLRPYKVDHNTSARLISKANSLLTTLPLNGYHLSQCQQNKSSDSKTMIHRTHRCTFVFKREFINSWTWIYFIWYVFAELSTIDTCWAVAAKVSTVKLDCDVLLMCNQYAFLNFHYSCTHGNEDNVQRFCRRTKNGKGKYL